MKRSVFALLGTLGVLAATSSSWGYVIDNWWSDGANVVMDDVFLPAATWSTPAQSQMSEWNQIDVTDNSHPFRINTSPQFSFGANDGDNTIGFLAEAGLNSEYGLSYASSLAWAIRWTNISGRYDECDVTLDPTLGWNLNPDNSNWFQSTVLHELGHCRGLLHYNNFLSIENSGTSKYLRAETLYMDDKVAIRQNATTVSERDIVMYNKWHDGSLPQWMTMSPTTLREGQTVNLNNITVENRGSQLFGSSVRFGIYLSTNNFISTGDQLLNTGSFSSFGTFSFSSFNWSAQIPTVSDCGTRWIGGIIDDNDVWVERFEGNNNVTFTNGVAYTGSTYTPTPLTIWLAEDGFEPNDSTGSAPTTGLPFSNSSLSIDQDSENDYYKVIVSKAGTFTINATFSHSTGDVNLRLLNSGGSTIANSLSTSNNESITHHVSAGGTYYIRVYGWGGGSCNKYGLTASFAPDPPDLVVTPVSVSDSTLLPSQSFTIYATARNQGVGSSDSTTLRYLLSTNSFISLFDTELGTDFVSGLSPSGTSSESGTFAAPANENTYWVGACVDTVANESNTGNQCSSAVQITVGRPDLTTEDVVLSTNTLTHGETFSIDVLVRNVGTLSAPGSTVHYLRSTNSAITTSDTEIGTDLVSALGAGDAGSEGIFVEAPLETGTWWIGACVDTVVNETQTANQCFTPGVQINVTPPDHLLLNTETLIGINTREACISITADPDVTIQAGGNITFQAGSTIKLGSGFSVENSAEFLAVISLPPGCL